MLIDTLKSKRRLVDDRRVTTSDLTASEERIKRTLTNRIYGGAAVVTTILSLLNYLLG